MDYFEKRKKELEDDILQTAVNYYNKFINLSGEATQEMIKYKQRQIDLEQEKAIGNTPEPIAEPIAEPIVPTDTPITTPIN